MRKEPLPLPVLTFVVFLFVVLLFSLTVFAAYAFLIYLGLLNLLDIGSYWSVLALPISLVALCLANIVTILMRTPNAQKISMGTLVICIIACIPFFRFGWIHWGDEQALAYVGGLTFLYWLMAGFALICIACIGWFCYFTVSSGVALAFPNLQQSKAHRFFVRAWLIATVLFFGATLQYYFALANLQNGEADGFPDVAHMQLIRNLRLSWSPVESGSPWIDCIEPLGEGDTKALAAAITGLSPEIAQEKLIETAMNIYIYINKAELEPGVYKLPEHAGKPYHEVHGVAADGSFTFTQEHLILLRHMNWDPPSREQIPALLEEGVYPFPLTDGKRPYGDFTWYEYEMAEILGEPFAIGADGNPVKDSEKDRRMEILHYQTLPALRALLLYGKMP